MLLSFVKIHQNFELRSDVSTFFKRSLFFRQNQLLTKAVLQAMNKKQKHFPERQIVFYIIRKQCKKMFLNDLHLLKLLTFEKEDTFILRYIK